MANVSGVGTIWNLPNYWGELFTASPERTPFLSIIGGLTGGGKMTTNFEFPVSSEYAHETAAQPSITETDSLTAPTALEYVRDQSKNVVEIHQKRINLSYVKQGNLGRLSGINTVGASNPAENELNWQISTALKGIARDVEYSLINGTYQIATSAAVANTTRGVIESADTKHDNTGTPRDLSKALVDALLEAMYTAGAYMDNIIIFSNAHQRIALSDEYAIAPRDRTIGGYAIDSLVTDFGTFGLVNSWAMPNTMLLFADVAYCAPVGMNTPNKGNFFVEELAKTGASEDYQLFGQIGLDHGPGFMHGVLQDLSES